MFTGNVLNEPTLISKRGQKGGKSACIKRSATIDGYK